MRNLFPLTVRKIYAEALKDYSEQLIFLLSNFKSDKAFFENEISFFCEEKKLIKYSSN